MGKKQQQNRTKGNIKPSSSGHAAELLTTSGGQMMGFVGFGALSGDLGYVPTSLGNDEADSSVDADFRMVLRKLTKKDSTTKLKAIQEMGSLCNSKDSEACKSILPYWPRLYCKIAMDHDRRVREATQQAFEQLVLRVRRSLAPHLKGLMGCWLVSQCDVYAPASSAAKAAFITAFPPAKQTDAILFCREEIINHFHENLLVHTPHTLSDPKTTSSEDMESKFQRVLTSSLLAFRLFLEMLPQPKAKELEEKIEVLLADKKFWKHAKGTDMVRGAFYSFLVVLCQYCPDLANKYGNKICPTVLHHLNESEPIIAGPLWEAALFTITVIQDCWQHVNPRKGVFPNIWSLMKSGGHGSAAVIYPNFLPLLSKLPPEVTGELVGFYQEFFGNMKDGLTEEKVLVSPSECSAIVKAFVECTQYCLLQTLDIATPQTRLQHHLIAEQLVTVIQASVVDIRSALYQSPLYAELTRLLHFFTRQANLENDEDKLKFENAAKILQIFWEEFSPFCVATVIEADPNLRTNYKVERLGTLLLSFKYPTLVEKKKTSHVTFTDSTDVKAGSGDAVPSQASGDRSESSASLALLLDTQGSFHALITKLSVDCYSVARHQRSLPHTMLLAKIMNSYASSQLFHSVLQHTDCEIAADSTNTMLEYVQKFLLPWLHEVATEKEGAGRGLLACVIDMIHGVYTCATSEDRVRILTQLCQEVDSSRALYRFLQQVLSEPVEPQVQNWLKGPVFGQKLLDTTERLCQQSLCKGPLPGGSTSVTQEEWPLLCLGLSTDDNFQPVVGCEYVDEILLKIRGALPSNTREHTMSEEELHTCVSFVCDVAENFFSNVKGCMMLSSAEDLLLALVQLSCQDQHHNMPGDLHGKVQATSLCGVQALVQQSVNQAAVDGFFIKAAQIFQQSIVKCTTVARVVVLSDFCGSIAETIAKNVGVSASSLAGTARHPTLFAFTQQLLGGPIEGSTLTQWMDGPLLTGLLTFPTMPSDKLPESSHSALPPSIVQTLFSARVLTKATNPASMATTPGEEKDAEEEAGLSEEVSGLDLVGEEDMVVLLNTAFAAAFCRAVLGSRAKGSEESELGQALTSLDKNLGIMLKRISVKQRKMLLDGVIEKSMENGDLWALALKGLLADLTSLKDELDIISHVGSLERLVPCSMSDIGTLSLTYHTATYTVGCGVREREPAEKEPYSGHTKNYLLFSTLNTPLLHTLELLIPYIRAEDLSPYVEIVAATLISSPPDQLTQVHGGLGSLAVLHRAMMALPGGAAAAAAAAEMGEMGSVLNADAVVAVLNEVLVWREEQDHLFAFNSVISSLSWPVVAFNVEMMGLLGALVQHVPRQLSECHWDFILCSTVAWAQSCTESSGDLGTDLPSQRFCVALSHLLISLAKCFEHDVAKAEAGIFPANLLSEWQEFFSEGAFSALLPLFVKFAENVDIASLGVAEEQLLMSLGLVVAECPSKHIADHKLPAKLDIADENINLPENLQSLLNHLGPLLQSPLPQVQIAAYKVLYRVAPGLASHDEGKTQDDIQEEPGRCPAAALMAVLASSEQVLEILFHDIEMGERVCIEHSSQDYTVSMAYLLTWKLLLTVFKGASAELRAEYSSFLKQGRSVERLLVNLFHLMPDPPVDVKDTAATAKSPSAKLSYSAHFFTDEPALDLTWRKGSPELAQLACAVYYKTLEYLPAVARQWWCAQDKKTAAIVNNFTTKYVSPLLCLQEIQSVQGKDSHLDNLAVKGRPSVREVVARYTVEEVTMELTLQLPSNHPLSSITVDTAKRIGVANNQWRNWMLQLTIFLQNQNGSIMDGLILWKQNVDKRFEGVEECMICFSVIHGSNCQLPKLQCKTCKKKYHSACLYKWFNTSNNSTCPLCRNLF